MENALNILHNPGKDKIKPKWVEKAIAEIRNNGWNPIIDYGVRVNIKSLKERSNLSSPSLDSCSIA